MRVAHNFLALLVSLRGNKIGMNLATVARSWGDTVSRIEGREMTEQAGDEMGCVVEGSKG